jgi:hypothetical protein
MGRACSIYGGNKNYIQDVAWGLMGGDHLGDLCVDGNKSDYK